MLRTLLQSNLLQSVALLRGVDLSDAALEQAAQVRGYVTIPLVTDHRQIALRVWPAQEDGSIWASTRGELLFVATRPDEKEVSFAFPFYDQVRAEKIVRSFDKLLWFFNGSSHDIRCYAYYRFPDPHQIDTEVTHIEFYEIVRLGATSEDAQKLHVYAIVEQERRRVIDFDVGGSLRSTEQAMQTFLRYVFG
jgi:hypothetical protein